MKQLYELYSKIRQPRPEVEKVFNKSFDLIFASSTALYMLLASTLVLRPATELIGVVLLLWTFVGVVLLQLFKQLVDWLILLALLPLIILTFVYIVIILVVLEFVVPVYYSSNEFFYSKKFTDYGEDKDDDK